MFCELKHQLIPIFGRFFVYQFLCENRRISRVMSLIIQSKHTSSLHMFSLVIRQRILWWKPFRDFNVIILFKIINWCSISEALSIGSYIFTDKILFYACVYITDHYRFIMVETRQQFQSSILQKKILFLFFQQFISHLIFLAWRTFRLFLKCTF